MSSGLAIALILAVMLAMLVLVGIFILVARNRRNRINTPPTAVAGPGYKHDLSRVQYFGQSAARSPEQHEELQLTSVKHEDLRNKPLPRCPFCETALAFGDVRCPKCGKELQQSPLKR
ncbi:MAG: hypothetical protein A3K76_02900 [Euryarchaeota archaeon RBG_13_57_23]|nr:MAG: hypothetical protein A3K76_02900 [Euryarchaeota archaeon RBG_13_57_23]